MKHVTIVDHLESFYNTLSILLKETYMCACICLIIEWLMYKIKGFDFMFIVTRLLNFTCLLTPTKKTSLPSPHPSLYIFIHFYISKVKITPSTITQICCDFCICRTYNFSISFYLFSFLYIKVKTTPSIYLHTNLLWGDIAHLSWMS